MDVLSQLDPPLDKNTLAFPKCNHRVSVCRVCSRLQPKHKSILMLENVKCGSHQKNGISLLGPENTKSDILKRTSKLARHPPPPCPHFSAFQVPPSPPAVRTSFMNGPLCDVPFSRSSAGNVSRTRQTRRGTGGTCPNRVAIRWSAARTAHAHVRLNHLPLSTRSVFFSLVDHSG